MPTPSHRPTRAALAKKHAAALKKLTRKGKLDPLISATVASNALASSTFGLMKDAAIGARLKNVLLAAHSFGGVMGRIQTCIQKVTGKRPGQYEPCVKRDDPDAQQEQADDVAVCVNIEFKKEWLPGGGVDGGDVNDSNVGGLTYTVMQQLN